MLKYFRARTVFSKLFSRWLEDPIEIDGSDTRLEELEARVSLLEERLLSYYKNRWDVIDKVADYLVGAQLKGDYFEFGVFEGRTFAYTCKVMAPLFPEMRFVALDSFSGLPQPRGLDAAASYTSGFHEGQFAASVEQFLGNVRTVNPELSEARLRTVKGWFHESLAATNPELADIGLVQAAWIDCDLYESTVPVLDYLTDKLQVGSVLLFDDWRCFRNLSELGEQRAVSEWLQRNPQIRLNTFVDFGFHGVSFTVATI